MAYEIHNLRPTLSNSARHPPNLPQGILEPWTRERSDSSIEFLTGVGFKTARSSHVARKCVISGFRPLG
jgi:hypothetical protein